MSDWPADRTHRMNESLLLSKDWEVDDDHGDDHGVGDYRKNPDYCQARRAFLSSYRFSEESGGFKDKLRRSLKEINRAGTKVALEIRREVSVRRIATRAFRFRFGLPSLAAVRVRCFTSCPGARKFFSR